MEVENKKLADDESSTSFLSNWRVIIPLLKVISDDAIALTCIRTIVDIIAVGDLPDIFHTLCFEDYIYHSDKRKRNYCHQLINLLCIRFFAELNEILSSSRSDGDFFTFDNFDILTVLQSQKHQGLLKSKVPVYLNSDREESEIYQIRWYERQKLKLERFLKLAADSDDVSLAIKYDTIGLEFVEDRDFKKAKGKRKASDMEATPGTNAGAHSLSEVEPSDLTKETWFARLFRYFIVNLSHDEWEVRSSSASAIEAILMGLNDKEIKPGEVSVSQGVILQMKTIPLHLLEDIVCLGLTVLVVDQFIDYDCDSERNIIIKIDSDRENGLLEPLGFSPVKERVSYMIVAASQLLFLQKPANPCRDEVGMKGRLFGMILDLCQNESWTTKLGGFLVLTAFLRFNQEFVPKFLCSDGWKILEKSLIHADNKEIAATSYLLLKFLTTDYPNRELKKIQFKSVISSSLRHLINPLLSSRKEGEERMLQDIRIFTAITLFSIFMNSEQENELKLCDDWSVFDYYRNFYCFIISESKQCIVSLSQLNIGTNLSSINECFRSIHLPTFIEIYPRLLSMLVQSLIFLAVDGFLSLQILIRAEEYDQTSNERSLFLFSLSDSWQINHRKVWNRHQNVIQSVVKVINAILNTKIMNEDTVQKFWTAVLSLILNEKLEKFSPDHQIPLITEITHACQDSFNLFSLDIPRKYLFFHILFVVNFPSELTSYFPSLEYFRIQFLNPLKECSNDITNAPQKLKKRRFVVVANNKLPAPLVSTVRTQADERKSFIEALLFELLLQLQCQKGNYSEIEPFVGKHPEFCDILKALKAIPQKNSGDIAAAARDLLAIMEKEWKGDLNSCIMEFLSRLIGGFFIDSQVENFIHVVQQLIRDEQFLPFQQSLDSLIASAVSMRTTSSEIEKLLNVLMSNDGQISEFHFHYLIYRLFTVLKIAPLSPFYQKVLENFRMNWRDFLNKFLYPTTFQQYSEKCLWLIVENVRLLRDFLILSERFQFIEYLGITLSKIIHENRNYDDNNLMQTFYSQLYIRFIGIFSNEISVSSFDVWLGIGVKGFGLFDLTLRSSCIQGFRLLVPLAPLGLHHLKKTCDKSFSLPLIQQLLARSKPAPIHESRDSLDQQILSTLFQQSSFSLSSEIDDKQRKVALRSYQWEGITWWTLLRRCGLSGILTDEMGLGKTVQALVCAAILRIEKSILAKTTSPKIGNLSSNIQNFHQDRSAPILIICPASLTFHWQSEIFKFFPDSALFHPLLCNNDFFQRRKRKLNTSDEPENGDIFIVSYDMLRNEANYFQSVTWEMIILDEAHLIRNPAIATTQAIFQLKSYYRLALTGTPLQNHVEDIWSIMNFLLPGYLGTFPSFQKEYVRPIKKTVQKVKLFHLSSNEAPISTHTKGRDTASATPSNLQWKGIELLNSLHKQILPFILRRNKSHVLKDLPPKTVIDILCPLSSLQEKMYRDGLAHFHSQDRFQGEINEEDLFLKYNKGRGDESNLENDTKIEEENHSYYEDVAQPARKNLLKANPFQFSFTMSQPTSSEKKNSNPLQLLTYLQSICYHPASVIDGRKHFSYYSSLARSLSSSGKFIQLLKLLIDIDIITEEDYSPTNSKSTNFDDFIKQIESSTNNEDLKFNDGEMKVVSDNEIDREDEQMEDSDSSSDDSEKIGKEKNDKKLGNSSVTSISKKCLIFCKYQQSLDLLETQLFQRYFPNLSFRRLDGSISPQERFKIATQFNSSSTRLEVPTRTEPDVIPLFPSHVMSQQPDFPLFPGDEIRILLMTTRSCGLGLNLCSADTVIFLEHDWNPFVDLQAMDRVHRLGQQNPVTVYRLLADAPVERRIQSLQNIKTDMADEVVCGKSFHQQKESEIDKNEKTLGLKLWESLSSKK